MRAIAHGWSDIPRAAESETFSQVGCVESSEHTIHNRDAGVFRRLHTPDKPLGSIRHWPWREWELIAVFD